MDFIGSVRRVGLAQCVKQMVSALNGVYQDWECLGFLLIFAQNLVFLIKQYLRRG